MQDNNQQSKKEKYIKKQEVSDHQSSQQRNNYINQSVVPETEKNYNNTGRWSREQHQLFLKLRERFQISQQYGNQKNKTDYKQIAKYVHTRTPEQVRSHSQKYQNKLQKIQEQKQYRQLAEQAIRACPDRTYNRSCNLNKRRQDKIERENQQNEIKNKLIEKQRKYKRTGSQKKLQQKRKQIRRKIKKKQSKSENKIYTDLETKEPQFKKQNKIQQDKAKNNSKINIQDERNSKLNKEIQLNMNRQQQILTHPLQIPNNHLYFKANQQIGTRLDQPAFIPVVPYYLPQNIPYLSFGNFNQNNVLPNPFYSPSLSSIFNPNYPSAFSAYSMDYNKGQNNFRAPTAQQQKMLNQHEKQKNRRKMSQSPQKVDFLF